MNSHEQVSTWRLPLTGSTDKMSEALPLPGPQGGWGANGTRAPQAVNTSKQHQGGAWHALSRAEDAEEARAASASGVRLPRQVSGFRGGRARRAAKTVRSASVIHQIRRFQSGSKKRGHVWSAPPFTAPKAERVRGMDPVVLCATQPVSPPLAGTLLPQLKLLKGGPTSETWLLLKRRFLEGGGATSIWWVEQLTPDKAQNDPTTKEDLARMPTVPRVRNSAVKAEVSTSATH